MLFAAMRAAHEKHNPGCITIDALAEVLSVDQVQGHLDRMKAQLLDDMQYMLASFDDWDADGSGTVTQEELLTYVKKEPRVMRMLQCVFFL